MDPDSSRPPSRLRRFGEPGRSARSRLRVIVSDGRGRPVRDGGLARWLAGVAPARAAGEVAVALVTDTRVRTLNRRYRGKDAATDVLSFPGLGIRGSGLGARIPNPADPESRIPDPGLGDIVIATGVAKRQAREARHSYQTELRVLALHGLLHLLGYDHDDTNDHGSMARVEARLRRQGGLAAGLIARSAGPAKAGRHSRPHSHAAGRVRRPRSRDGSADRP